MSDRADFQHHVRKISPVHVSRRMAGRVNGEQIFNLSVPRASANGEFNGEVADVRLDVDDYITVDWQTTWNIVDWVQLTIGADNLLDEEPQFSVVGVSSGADRSQADLRQRFVYVQVSKQF